MKLINVKTHTVLEVSGNAGGGDWMKLADYEKLQKAKAKAAKEEAAKEESE